jgi:hypothetical protein
MAGSSIGDRIAALGKNFAGFNIGNSKDGSQIIYLEVSFPEGYGISGLIESKFGVKAVKTTKGPNTYYFYAPLLEVGFDSVFDAAEFNIRANEEAQEKKMFLAEKIKELEKIVMDEDMATLKTLEFKITKKKTRTVAGGTVKKKENNEEKKEDNVVD